MKETQLNGESLNIVTDNIEKMKQLFPEIITEDKIDFNKLKEILGKNIEESDERYNFTWPGKTEALRESQKSSTGTLNPCKEDSKNWDSTQNLYIEGDNLEVLKILQKSYYNKVKMIYIDPPYNTGNDFVYPDNYKDNLENYLEITNQIKIENGETIKFSSNPETNGRYHSNWLNMMYPRLKLARNLLTNDGVVFISIGENEIENLKKLCNEIFGEENVELMIWEKVSGSENAGSGKMKITQRFRKDHEYIVICYKSKLNTIFNKPLRIKKTKNEYGNIDNDYRGNWMSCEICKSENKSNPNGKNYFEVVTPAGKKISRQWHYNLEELKELDEDNRIYWGKGDIIPRLKKFLDEPSPTTPSSVIMGLVTQTEGNNDLKYLNLNFDNPKPVNLIKWLLEITENKNDFILDFFSGSSTTAQAILQLNNENNNNNKFIMVQLPEETDEKSEAYKSGFKNICEVGKERIRRAGDKILEGSEDKDLDVGFKVFKLDSSNLTKWNPDYDNLEDSLISNADNIISDRSDLDLVYEVMLKYGIDLSIPVDEIEIDDKKVYNVGFGALFVCLDDNLTVNIADELVDLIKDADSSVTRVVFKDNGFASDSDKTNVKETLRASNVNEFITI